MIDPKYLIYHDLIGIKAYAKSISMSKDKHFSNIGVIIDETRNTLLTKKNNNVKKYIKKDYVFRFRISNDMNDQEDYYLEVQGNKIVGLPVNRLRSLKKRRWLKK
ncbi:MAG: ribonuclease P protein subunit [Promethearchaeota archaeon]|nr:MAG: ribonuclease P protein subunit [Candidatus Lokiarchaeota archaeon]